MVCLFDIALKDGILVSHVPDCLRKFYDTYQITVQIERLVNGTVRYCGVRKSEVLLYSITTTINFVYGCCAGPLMS